MWRMWRANSIAIVSSDLITPSPWHTGHGLVMISRTPSVTFWRVISTRPSGEISTTKVFVRSSSSALRSVLSTASRLRARAMSMKSMTMIPPMSRRRSWLTTSSAASRLVLVIVGAGGGGTSGEEVDDDDPADVAQAELVDDLVGRLQVGLGDRVLEPGGLALAGEGARVDVDDRQRLGVVDHQVAAAGQVDAPREHPGDHVLDPVLLEQLLLVGVELDALHQLGRGAGEERDQAVVLLLVVDERALEVGGEDVAHDAHGEVGLLEDERRRGRLGDALVEDLVQLEEVLQLALEV